MSEALIPLQHGATMLFASVLLLTVVFLIARVAHVRQTFALALALAPMAIGLVLEHAAATPIFG